MVAPGGQLHDRERVALVLLGQEAARQAREQETTHQGDHHEHDHPSQHVTDRAADIAGIGFLGPVKAAVEPAEHDVLFLVRIMRLEHARAQRRRECEREERREAHRHRDRQRELAIDRADAAGLHRTRNKHGREHHRDRDHRAGDLAHRLARRFLRRQTFLGHDAFDVFDDDDRVVDDDADREHHAEQGQLVDREADHPHAEEPAHQRDRNHQRRDQGHAEVLQEHQHHEEHEDDRLEQRLDHFLDRDLDEVGGVVRHEPRHAGGKPGCNSASLALIALATPSAFAPVSSCTPKPEVVVSL